MFDLAKKVAIFYGKEEHFLLGTLPNPDNEEELILQIINIANPHNTHLIGQVTLTPRQLKKLKQFVNELKLN
jgi:hypothetical protein